MIPLLPEALFGINHILDDHFAPSSEIRENVNYSFICHDHIFIFIPQLNCQYCSKYWIT